MPDPATPAAASAPAAPSGPSAPTPSPQTTESPAPAQTTPTPPSGAERAPEAEKGSDRAATAEISDEVLWERVAKLDPREIAKRHRLVANYIGNEADRLEKMRAAQRHQEWQSQQAQRAEAEELRRLRDEDPVEYVEREKQYESRLREVQTREQQLVQAQRNVWGVIDLTLRDFHTELPAAVQDMMLGKTFDEGDAAQSRKAYLREVTRLLREHAKKDGIDAEVEREVARRSKEIEQGLKTAMAAERGEGEPGVDLGAGAKAPEGPMTQSEYDARARDNPTYRRANRARFAAGVEAGLITRG